MRVGRRGNWLDGKHQWREQQGKVGEGRDTQLEGGKGGAIRRWGGNTRANEEQSGIKGCIPRMAGEENRPKDHVAEKREIQARDTQRRSPGDNPLPVAEKGSSEARENVATWTKKARGGSLGA